eukprot:CAMPEP_0113626240 /NCGR_PEP_ID=MMETSP0017_2-20120614/13571_1 /TAXON_ID=2856 /ORGANISM="Cylindrotheca closterium" /LENGTH=516 /DNA_ID=CAMNT_0000536415 /DNA_START=23 /DNA_END=1573 /DNA_ORIENTATION=- /assembly_acc=CAM_ASM_000147
MSDDLLPWIEETYGQVQRDLEITFWNPADVTKDPINIQDVADLASIPDDFDTIYVEAVITNLSDDALKLLNLLQNDPRNWEEIAFIPPRALYQPSSPAFFAILTAAMKKTKRLLIGCDWSDITAYSCLAAGLLAHDGIRELQIVHLEQLEVDAVKVLAEAMVHTTCLKLLEIYGHNPLPENICAVFLEGLTRNRSLDTLKLRIENDNTSLSKFFRTLQNHPNLRSLDLKCPNMSEQVMENLREWLCRDDCRLQDLGISRVSHLSTLTTRIGGQVFESRSLKRLQLSCNYLSSNNFEGLGLCNTFPNLSILSLYNNNICDLSPLESIFCKGDCKIQDLDLRENLISHDSIMNFAAKIPQMKSLRRLYLSDNPFLAAISSLDGREQSALLQPLLKRVKESKSLERLSMKCKIDATELCHTMNVNRGGQRGIEVESAHRCISLALWPRILHRASSINYFADIDSKWFETVEEPTDETPRAAVVFSLLRDHANIFEHCGKAEEEDVPNLPASKKQKVGVR